MKNKKKVCSVLIYFSIFILFIVFAAGLNWSLLLGENLMKWDIWDAEYPNQLLMTDALENGTLMLWNPLMQYGTPVYAMIGTPVWYPITLLLAIIGYTPSILAFSYVIHIAIGGFGMFLLGQQELKDQSGEWTATTLTTSAIVGLLYCSSGLFLSNAEHIMIIISAAWIPYVFFFMREYIEKRYMLYAMFAGISAGMILLGGYPELFYDIFLFLVPYTLYFQYEKQKSIFCNIFYAAKKYMLVAVYTALSSAIILIPFLNIMELITRSNDIGQVPQNVRFGALLSILFPGAAAFAGTADTSMVNFYMGILTVLLIPTILKIKSRNKLMYLSMAGVALVLCLGSNSFLHNIFYRFLPMYASFRFPSINRCILVIFMLLNVANAFQGIMSQQEQVMSYGFSKKIFFFVIVLAAVFELVGIMSNDSFGLDKTSMIQFAKSAWVTAIVVGAYLVLFYSVSFLDLKGWRLRASVCVLVVVMDIVSFHHVEFPSTIARYDHIEYSYNKSVQEVVRNEFEKSNNRNKTVDFANSIRADSKLDSHSIVFNKYLDGEGYVSVKLQNIQDYKDTYLRSIMSQNPEAYFTNDVVTPKDVDYTEWVNNGCTPPEQIYVDDSSISMVTENKVRFEQNILNGEKMSVTVSDETVCIEGIISAGVNKTSRLRLHYDCGITGDKYLTLAFYDDNGNCQQYEGEFECKMSENGYYVDIYFPSIDKIYTRIDILSSDRELPVSAQLVDTGRMQNDGKVNIDFLGFNDISMTVNAPTDGYVTILQAKYNGWKAYVDGIETQISTVDNCFMGIRVSEGTHIIILEFRPYDFYIGAAISCGYVIILCCMIVNFFFLKRKEKQEILI